MNDKFAVISINSKQFIVSEGDVIETDKLDKVNVKLEVLMFSDKGKVKFGDPVLKDQKIDFSIVGDTYKGDKIHVFKYKSKSRYRKKIGFRPLYSKIKINKFS